MEGRGGSTKQPAIFSPSDAEKLLHGAHADPKLHLAAAVTLGLFAGIRTEEIVRLKWDAIHLEHAKPFVSIGPEIVKKRRIRNVPLVPPAVAWLRQLTPREGNITRDDYKGDFQTRDAQALPADQG